MLGIGNLIFVVELLFAELILLFNYPRKKYFAFRFIGGLIVLFLIVIFCIPFPDSLISDPIIGFLRFVILLGLTISLMLFCFDGKGGAVISGCIAGYAVQHITYQIKTLLSINEWINSGGFITEFIVFAIVYIIFFFTLGLFIRRHNYYENYQNSLIIISAIIIFVCIFVYRFARLSANDNMTKICIALYSITCCSLALAIQYIVYELISLKISNKTLETIISQKEGQYEISKQNMDLLNIKCHDLKHQLNLINKDEAREIQKIIDIYDNPVKTGFDVLDVTLNEKIKILYDKGIKINFTGNGKLLNWINDVDIYSLFGNALDNAIEALDKVNEKKKKVINISLESKGDLILVTIMNYYNGKLKFEKETLVTSKNFEQGYHGYGIKSIQYVVKKYNGNLKIYTNNNIFKLTFSFLTH